MTTKKPALTAASTARFASSLRGGARKAVKEDPVARGADWREATVGSISGGVIVTTDGVKSGFLTSYTPTVGDRVVLTQSGGGNWMILGQIHS